MFCVFHFGQKIVPDLRLLLQNTFFLDIGNDTDNEFWHKKGAFNDKRKAVEVAGEGLKIPQRSIWDIEVSLLFPDRRIEVLKEVFTSFLSVQETTQNPPHLLAKLPPK